MPELLGVGLIPAIGGGVAILFGLFVIGMARIAVMRCEARCHPCFPGGPAALGPSS